MRATRILALLTSVVLATAVALPAGSAAGTTIAASAVLSRPAVKVAAGPASSSSKPGFPKALTAPTGSLVVSQSRALVSEASADPAPAFIDPLAPAVPGELVVVLDAGTSAATSKRALEARGAKVGSVTGDEGSLLVRTPRGVNDPVFNAIAAQAPGVAWVQPNYIYTAAYIPTGDSLYAEQWGLPRIGAPAAWDVTHGRSSVLVAVVDSGADLSHPDLAGRVDTVNDHDFVNGDVDASDDNGHGTHVAGIVAAAENNGGTIGVAPECRILPVKVLDSKGSGTTDVVAAGVRYAADNGAKVINLSIGGLQSTDFYMAAAVEYAQGKGCVIVAAAGNEGRSGADYPARYDGVIGVGATNSSDALASFSNYGDGVDIVAPGVSIHSTFPGGGYERESGTSMASPFVAGVAALLFSANPTWNDGEVIDRILSTAQDIGLGGDDGYYGHGLVRADLAVGTPAVSADDAIPGVPLTPSPVEGALSATDKDDVYSVYLGEGQTLEAVLAGDEGTDFDLKLFAPLPDAALRGISATRAYPERITYTASATGWYYLDVAVSPDPGGDVGAYTLAWERTGSSDDNIPGVPMPDSPAGGALDSAEDFIDVYRVDVVAGQQLTVFMTATDGNADYDLWLYGPGSTSIDVDAPLAKRESPYSGELLRYVAAESGTYSVAVFAYAGAGAYQLEWSRGPFDADDNIPGVDITQASIESTIGGLADTDDVYKCYLQAGQSVDAKLTDLSGGGTDPNLYVYDPTRTNVDLDPWVAEATSTVAVESLRYTAQATGYHYLDVYSGGEPGAYRLEWSTTAAADDNIPGVGAPAARVYGGLGVTTDTDDVYRVYAKAGQRISVSLAGAPSAGTDFDLYLFSPEATGTRTGTPVAKADGATYPKSIGFTATRTGYHYLLAHAFAGEGTYTLDWWVRSYAGVTKPVAPSRAIRRRSFTVYGYVAPRHSSGYYLVKLHFYRRNSRGDYVYHHTVSARRYYYSTASTKYRVTTSLATSGMWRVRAYHADSAHVPIYSAYRYIAVRVR